MRKRLGFVGIGAAAGSSWAVAPSGNLTCASGFERIDHGVACTRAKLSGDHLSSSGLLFSDLAVVTPPSV